MLPKTATSLISLAVIATLGCHTASPDPTAAASPVTASSGSNAAPDTSGINVRPVNSRPRAGSGHAGPIKNAPPGAFDFYLLNLSWSPEYCASNPGSPECPKHLGFVVHGLWPEDNNSSYPEDCGNAPGPTNPQADTDLMPTVALVEHEWQIHGTCSGLAADAYFSTVRAAFHEITIPPGFIGVKSAESLTPKAILQQFASANPSIPANGFVLSCGNNQLTAIEVCLTKSLAGESCPNVATCHANKVKVTPQ